MNNNNYKKTIDFEIDYLCLRTLDANLQQRGEGGHHDPAMTMNTVTSKYNRRAQIIFKRFALCVFR